MVHRTSNPVISHVERACRGTGPYALTLTEIITDLEEFEMNRSTHHKSRLYP